MTAVTVTDRLMTADELFALPDDGMRHELVRGRLTTMVPPGHEHGRIAKRVGRLLDDHVEAGGLGETITTEVGFQLGPNTVRAPDIAFIARSRSETVGVTKKYWPGAPDVAIEVVSPNDTYSDVHEKALEWLAAGCRLVLAVDPGPRTVTAYRSPADIRVHRGTDTVDATDVVAGWAPAAADMLGPAIQS